MAPRLDFQAEIFRPDTVPGAVAGTPASAPLAALQVSGIFRIARFLPLEVLLAWTCLLGAIFFLALGQDGATRTLTAIAAAAALGAWGLFAWLAAASHAQWRVLAGRAPWIVSFSGGHANSVLGIGPGLYLPVLFLLAATLWASRSAAA